MKIVIREYKKSDLDQIRELYLNCFGDHLFNKFIQKLKEGDSKGIKWKYQTKGSTRVVAEIDGKIIGYHGGLFRLMCFQENKIRTIEFVDLMVHKDYRKRGIATEIEKYHERLLIKKGIDLILRFPNNINESRICKKSQGYFVLTPIPLLEKIKLKARSAQNIFSLNRFDCETDKLLKRIQKKLGITTIRNKDYLNWRFVENPINKYKLFVYKTGDVIRGYVVLKKYEDREHKFGHIVDVISDSEESLKNLILFCENYFVKQKVDKVTAYIMFGSKYYSSFLDEGFVPRKTDRNLFIKPLNKKYMNFCNLNKAKQFHITMMDHDIY